MTKLTKLQDIVSTMIDSESDAVMTRSDRAADLSMATGYSNRYGKRGRTASSVDRIIPKISR